jgi:hypothetical protein
MQRRTFLKSAIGLTGGAVLSDVADFMARAAAANSGPKGFFRTLRNS